MGLLNDLLKPKGRQPATVAEAEAALVKLNAERDAANETAKAATRRRADLLLVDGSESKIVEAEAATDAARLTIERLDAAEPLLLQRLAELRDVVRTKLRAKLIAEHEAVVGPYVEAHRLAAAAAAKVHAARAALIQHRFQSEANALPAPPPFLIDLGKAAGGHSDFIAHPDLDKFETDAARAHRALLGAA